MMFIDPEILAPVIISSVPGPILKSWKCSGLRLVEPTKPTARRENLARYIIRASFSQERMTYIAADDSSDGTAKVVYQIPAADDYLIDPDR